MIRKELGINNKNKKLVNTVIELFTEHGPSLKMEDVAKAMNISKKTIYKDYGNKEDLIVLVVEAIIEGIDKQVQLIINNNSNSTLEKLIQVTCTFPDAKDIDYHKALALKDDFPRAYAMFIKFIEDSWQISTELFYRAVEEGVLKDIDHDVFRIIMLGITKQILDSEFVNSEAILEKCVRQVFEGLIKTNLSTG